MEQVFKQVIGLWLCPEFTDAQGLPAEPSRVDHDCVDFPAMAAFLESHFDCGERVRVRMPDDSIDRFTIHARMHGPQPESARCVDFAEMLLTASHGGRDTIAIREQWTRLHQHKNRNHAPPPALLMFVVGGDFEAVTIWHAQAALRLGIRAADLAVLLSGDLGHDDLHGNLTTELATELRQQFGAVYRSDCMLTKMVSTPPPHWALAQTLH